MDQQQERQWGMIAHLSALSGFIIPFGSLIAPLVIWQMKKDESAYVAYHAKEALNFQITVVIAGLVCALLTMVLIGLLLLPVLLVWWLVFTILPAMKANAGENYTIPYILRLVN
jgi:uncharacterized protein